MGRTAKYTTPKEKRQAISANSPRYAHTNKGRDTRNTTQWASYHRRTSRKGPSDTSTHPLSQDLLNYTLEPLPSSNLFVSTLHDDGTVDESELDHWDLPPPYTRSQTLSSSAYTINLVDVVHGQNLRHHRREGRVRMEVYRSRQSLKGACQAILAMEKGEIDRYTSVLKDIEENVESDMLYVGGMMAKVFLLWYEPPYRTKIDFGLGMCDHG
ncbi:hypothetical protein FIBSPDRAFT_883680 [Athelia psychrophila]|uniref:Uncharacterized protein n=1 Tax=Athelia psychrophila TaxID=1759441 RepID=A0A166TTS6_9AGAM|nr:hypothetical protein FIBSPDRAFT_883680 [Fibularhizoctonia sp. CBS 109695]